MRISLVVLVIPLALAACGPDAAWNCDIGTRRCRDGVGQLCVLDHADTTPDGTLTTYVGRWVDEGKCR